MEKEIIIFKTGKVYELDLASNALKEANIPHYTQQENSAGAKFAMPANPVAGPGIWYSIIVSDVAENEVKRIVNALPIEIKTNPSVWSFSPKDRIKNLWKIFAISIIAIYILILLIDFLRNKI